MPELPTGTVTLLFTDIEGSTKLLEEHGARYAELLDEHRRVLRAAFERHGGIEVDTQGDAFFVAFSSAADAVAAAEEAQQTLELPVRMGIHTGEPQLTDGGYVGIDVHRAARICSAAHGRQVVLSDTTRAGVVTSNSVLLSELGMHRLKDLGEPVKLYQLGEQQFPPLRSLNATNLPAQPSALIGRERELAELLALVQNRTRLLTLTGPGGSGKTRLALQASAEAVEAFSDGVFWVPLAAVTDPGLVEPTIAQTLGAKVPLPEHVDEKRMLLLLDNLEQVIECAPVLSELLASCPNLKLLVTSRVLLKIEGERDYPVEPLPEDDAVTLFRERAAVSDPLEAVHEICRRLDGLPLAVELAAARTRLLPPDQLLTRLERALPILTGGRRDAPERQRTLRATIEWSYELLDDGEQRLFGRLSVFAGSFTLEAAEEVCDVDLDTLESLVEHSLVRRWASGRLGMLETIREFAAEQLDASDEAGEVRRRHLDFFTELAESANLCMERLDRGPQRHELVAPELPNIRSAIEWAAEVDLELALRLACTIENFWVTNSPAEGARLFGRLMSSADGLPDEVRARGLRCLGSSSTILGDFERGRASYEESLALFRRIGDERGTSHLLMRLAFEALREGDVSTGRRIAEETLELSRRHGFTTDEAQALSALAHLAYKEGRHEEAFELLRRSAELCANTGFRWWEKNVLMTIAEHMLELGRSDEAFMPARRGLEIAHAIGDRQGLVEGLALLAWQAATAALPERAGKLWGAIDAEEERGGRVGQWEEYRPELEEHLRVVAGAEFEAARTAGRAMSRDEAVEYALSNG
jgi:predicted ATPase